MSYQKDKNKRAPKGQKRIPARKTRLSTLISKLPPDVYTILAEEDEKFEELLDDLDYGQSLADRQ